jgi:hypothetical protein
MQKKLAGLVRKKMIKFLAMDKKQKFFTFSFIALLFFSFSFQVFAGQFPNDALTLRTANDTSQDILNKSILPNGIYTILNITVNSKDERDNTLYCGNSILFKERKTPYTELSSNFLCNNTITADLYRTSTITITYVPYNLRLVTTSIGNFTLDNGATFTAGDMFSSFLLLIGLIIALVIISIKASRNVKIYKTYTGVNQMEGKEHYDI